MNDAPVNSLPGLYRLDSIAIIRDTAPADVLALMVLHSTSDGSIRLRFTTDSVFTYEKSDTSASPYHFDARGQRIVLQSATGLDSFNYKTGASGRKVMYSPRHELYLTRL